MKTARPRSAPRAAGAGPIAGPQARREAVAGVVGDCRVVGILRAEDHPDRAEELVGSRRTAGRGIGEHRRGVEEARSGERRSPGPQAGPGGDRGLDLRVQVIPEVGPRQRSDADRRIGGIPDRERAHPVHEARHEAIPHGRLDDEPLRGDAALPGVEAAGGDPDVQRGLEVRVGPYDEDQAAQLQHRGLEGRARHGRRPPRPLAAQQCCARTRVRDEVRDPLNLHRLPRAPPADRPPRERLHLLRTPGCWGRA